MQPQTLSFSDISLTRLFFVMVLMSQLVGCTSFGKGVVQALLEKSEEQDTRVCQIRGKAFDGLQTSLLNKPLEAHVGYDSDDRVVALIAKGIGNEYAAELIKERCEWTKVTE